MNTYPLSTWLCAASTLATPAGAQVVLSFDIDERSVATPRNTPVGLPLAQWLANGSDLDGDTLTLVDVCATSANGGSVSFTASDAHCTPLHGFTGADRFPYTISDGRGGAATATVEVLVVAGNLPSENQVSLLHTATSVIVGFAGVPGDT